MHLAHLALLWAAQMTDRDQIAAIVALLKGQDVAKPECTCANERAARLMDSDSVCLTFCATNEPEALRLVRENVAEIIELRRRLWEAWKIEANAADLAYEFVRVATRAHRKARR
jgi:hypothetical protein